MVSNYSKHGDINKYIEDNIANKDAYLSYRNKWNNNVNNELLFLLLETTYKCNLKCEMCIHSVGYDKCETMSSELFDKALNGIKAMQIPSVCMNQVNEPLLDSLIFERIEKVASIDSVVDIHMNTNAILLNEDRARQILNSGLTRLLIGFDGFSKETYERVRSGGKYDSVLNNILNFLELKKQMKKVFPIVRISFVKTSLNENEIEDWFNFWKDKVDYIAIQEFVTPVLDDSKAYLIPKSSSRIDADINSITCDQPSKQMVVRGDGDILPCCSHFATKMPVGNLNTNSLQEIWNGQKINNLREMFRLSNWNNHKICSPCLKISYGID